MNYLIKVLAFTPLIWICLGVYTAGGFYLSTGVWPANVNYSNQVRFPEHFRMAFDAFQIMFVTSFLYLPAIFILMAFNVIVVRKRWREFLFFWGPFFMLSTLLAFFFATFFYRVFEFYT
jgi:hypothetical protein